MQAMLWSNTFSTPPRILSFDSVTDTVWRRETYRYVVVIGVCLVSVWLGTRLNNLKNDFSIFDTHACLHFVCIHVESAVDLRTCTMISRVSRIIMLASVARLPSISASCSSSALVLQLRNQRTMSQVC